MKPTFGSRVKELRSERNMSQKELAEALGLAHQTISYYERSTGAPKDINLVNAVADMFHVDIKYVLGTQNERKLHQYDMDTVRRDLDKNGYAIVRKEEADSQVNLIPQVKILKAYTSSEVEYFALDNRIKADNYYLVEDDSMKDFGISKNSILFFEDLGAVQDGKIGLFLYRDEILLRMYRKSKGNTEILIPGNVNEEVIIVTDGTLQHIGHLTYGFKAY